MSLELTLRDGRASFSPGETVEGEARWALPEAPESVEVRLFWRTEGEGNADLDVVETVAFDGPGSSGRRAFTLRLPAGPWSFQGPLIHLLWAVELVASPGGEAARIDLTLAPGGREIQLQKASDPVEEKAEKVASGCLALFGKKLPQRG